MEDNETIVIDVQLNEEDIASRLAEINQKMAAVASESKAMKQAIKEATEGIQESEMAIAENALKLNELKEQQDAVAQQYAAVGGQIQALVEEQERLNQVQEDNNSKLQANQEAMQQNQTELDALTAEYDRLAQAIQTTGDTEGTLSQQLADTKGKIDALDSSQSQLLEMQAQINQSIQVTSETMTANQEQIEQLTLKQGDLSDEMKAYDLEIKEVSSASQQLQGDIDGYKEAITGATVAIVENTAETRALKSEQQTLEGQIKGMTEGQRTYADSLKGMRAELAALKDEYASLSAAERESATGQELLEHIAQLDEEVKETNFSMGDFQTNVGNYPKVVTSIIPGFDKMTKVMGNMGTSFQELSKNGIKSFKSLGVAVKTFGKAFVSWPIIVIVAVLSAIMLVVNAVRDALKRNDQMLTQVQKSLAILEPILKIVEKSFDLIGKAVAFLIEQLVSAVEWVGRFLTSIGLLPDVVMETVDAKKALVQAIDDLEEAERQYTVNSAKREMELSELRAKMADKEKYSFEERKAMLEQAQELERQDLEEKKAMAEENLRIILEEQRLAGDYSDEMADKIAEAQAKVYNATKEFNEGMRQLQAEANKLIAEQEREQQAIAAQEKKEQEERLRKAREYAKKRAEIAKKQATEIRNIEKTANQALLDERQRSNEEYYYGLQQEIQAKKNQLAENRHMSIEEQTQLNAELIELERNLNVERIRMDETLAQQRRQTEFNEFKLGVEQRIEELRKENALTEEIEAGLLAQIETARQVMNEQNVQGARVAADQIAQYDLEAARNTSELVLNERAKTYQRDLQLLETVNEQRRIMAEGDAVALAQIDYEEALAKQQMLLSIDEETKAELFASEQEYTLALLEANQEIVESYNGVTKAIMSQVATYAEATSSIMSSIGGVFDAIMEGMDEESEEYKEMARAQALLSFGEIGVQMAVGLAKAIAAGAGLMFPANLAAIAAGVAAVASGIASAISTYNKYKDYFAEGGIVGGDKYKGDKLVAHLNSGEMVLNKEQQARLFQLANQSRVSDQTQDFDQMVEAFGTALENQPQPVLDYTEFQQFTKKVDQRNSKVSMK